MLQTTLSTSISISTTKEDSRASRTHHETLVCFAPSYIIQVPIFPHLRPSLVEELQGGIAGLDRTPCRRVAICVGVPLIRPQRVEAHVFYALRGNESVSALHNSVHT